MHLRKKGSILISSMLILSLMSIIGSLLFIMMKNNKEIASIYSHKGDIYNMSENEENILNQFMRQLNRKETLEEDSNYFEEDFIKEIHGNKLRYNKDEDRLILITNKENEIIRTRDIRYEIKEEKIILIPTYKFNDDLG